MSTKNITLSLPPAYYSKFDEISKKKHLSKSELLRRWIDDADIKMELDTSL